MACPLYPSLIPRYVDDSWFASDQPIDEAAILTELEANHELWIRDSQYRSVDVHAPHVNTMNDEGHDDDEEEGGNEDDEEEGEEMEEDDEMDEDYVASDSPHAL